MISDFLKLLILIKELVKSRELEESHIEDKVVLECLMGLVQQNVAIKQEKTFKATICRAGYCSSLLW